MNTVSAARTTHHKPGVFFWLLTTISFIFLTALPTMAQDQPIDLSGTAPAALSDEMLTQIDAYVADAAERYGIPGATLAIVQDGKIIHTSGFGVRELGQASPVTPDTLFMIGSLPKSMTAMMIGTLVDEGVLGWDTPVVHILPDFKLADAEASRTVTFRDLLSMRSGLQNSDISLFIQPYSPEQVIEGLATIPLIAKPGEQYAYSNQGYSAAGFIAAIATGAKLGDNDYDTYSKLMQERVFDPIGMQHTTFDFDAGVASADVASPHSFDLKKGGFSPFPVGLERGGFSIIPAGGSTWSNAEDLGRYLITQMNHGVNPDGKQVISEERLLDTWRPEIPSGNDNHYALGWVVKPDYYGLQQIEYGAGNLGYTSLISFLPEAKLGVIVLTSRIAGDAFTHAMSQYVYETAFGLEHAVSDGYFGEEQGFQGMVAQIGSGVEAQIDPASVAQYLGAYDHGTTVHFNDDGDLVMTAAFGDFPLYELSGQAGSFVMGIAFGLGVQFAEDGSSFTISSSFGEAQAAVTLTRMN